ncbi:hypothetical protein L839_3575 [Mycobacterium avium MAV_120809_2495]|nr:hypothetical protein L839_3575 [Mycobacterium avium MAV_120809_2495]
MTPPRRPAAATATCRRHGDLPPRHCDLTPPATCRRRAECGGYVRPRAGNRA